MVSTADGGESHIKETPVLSAWRGWLGINQPKKGQGGKTFRLREQDGERPRAMGSWTVGNVWNKRQQGGLSSGFFNFTDKISPSSWFMFYSVMQKKKTCFQKTVPAALNICNYARAVWKENRAHRHAHRQLNLYFAAPRLEPWRVSGYGSTTELSSNAPSTLLTVGRVFLSCLG